MIIYFDDGYKIVDFESFAVIASAVDTDREIFNDEFTVVAKLKHYNEILELYKGTSKRCDGLIKDIVAAYERGDKVFRIDWKYWEAKDAKR